MVQVLYAAALIPIGLLADRVNRPRLLAGGLVLWSLLTMTGSKVGLHVTSGCGQESSLAKLELLCHVLCEPAFHSCVASVLDFKKAWMGTQQSLYSLRKVAMCPCIPATWPRGHTSEAT